MTTRQVVPPVFVSSLLVFGVLSFWNGPARLVLLAEMASYALTAFGAALIETVSRRDSRLILLMLVYPVMHIAYGVGYAVGAARLVRGTHR